jgi:hypothetical protein
MPRERSVQINDGGPEEKYGSALPMSSAAATATNEYAGSCPRRSQLSLVPLSGAVTALCLIKQDSKKKLLGTPAVQPIP